jgi:hypothetical protein
MQATVIDDRDVPAKLRFKQPGMWGNPFSFPDAGNTEETRALHKAWVDAQPWYRDAVIRELTGEALGSPNKPGPCHSDELARICNEQTEADRPAYVFASDTQPDSRHNPARADYGAQAHVRCGMTGDAYALPLHGDDAQALADGFLAYARSQPHRQFMFAGIARDDTLLPMFQDAPPNVFLPGLWQEKLGLLDGARVIVAGGRDFDDYGLMTQRLDHLFSRMDKPPVIVSGAANGADLNGEGYAGLRGLRIERFPAWWRYHGKKAGPLRNFKMAWRATHLVAFWDGKSRGTKSMIEMATREGLRVRVVRY